MSPKEIINILDSHFKIKMTERTIYNYSEWGLIPKPQRGAGRSGKWVDYPEGTLFQLIPSWCLLHGNYLEEEARNFGLKGPKLNPELVAVVRSVAIEASLDDMDERAKEIFDNVECFGQDVDFFEEQEKYSLGREITYFEERIRESLINKTKSEDIDNLVILLGSFVRLWLRISTKLFANSLRNGLILK